MTVRSRFCSTRRIDADALEAQVLAALSDFYTNHLDEGHTALTASRAVDGVVGVSTAIEVERHLAVAEARFKIMADSARTA